MSHTLHFTIAAGLVLRFAGIGVAADLTAKDYIEFMNPLVGSWKATVESEGQEVKGTWDVRIAPGGYCLTTVATGIVPATQSIDGYDPVARKWTALLFNAAGEHIYTTHEISGMAKGKVFGEGVVMTSERKTSKSDGTITEQTSTMTCLECTEKKIVAQWSEVKEGGKSLPGWLLTLERQQRNQRGARPKIEVAKLVGDRLTTQDYVDYLRPFEGSWKTKIEIDGDVLEGTWSGRISPTKACFLSRGELGAFPKSQGIDGYDPGTKCWTVGSFDAEGGFTIGRLKFEGIEKGKVVASGVTAASTRKEYKPDGTTTESSGRFTIIKCDQQEIVYKLTEQRVNGESQPDATLSMERQPRRRKTGKS